MWSSHHSNYILNNLFNFLLFAPNAWIIHEWCGAITTHMNEHTSQFLNMHCQFLEFFLIIMLDMKI